VWKSGPVGAADQDYFLALDCGGDTISVYQGTPDNHQGTIWTSQANAAPPSTPAVPPPSPAAPAPTPAAPQPTMDSSGCKLQVLLLPGEFVQSNSWSMKVGTDVYMYQESNGNVYVRKGSKQSPKALVWQSDISLWNADYFTKLQADGTYSD